MFDRRLWRHFDYLLIGLMMALIVFGVAMIYSAAWQDPDIQRTPVNQAITAMAGMLLLLLLVFIDYTLFKGVAWLMYSVTLAALALVLVPGIGQDNYGAQRWFRLGSIEVQPAELAKLTLGIVIAQFISSREGKWPYLRTVAVSFLLLAPCAGLILVQPNLSSVMILLFMWLAMVFAGGIKQGHAVTMSVAGVAFIGAFFLLNYTIEQTCILPANSKLPAGRATKPGEPDNCRGLILPYQLGRINRMLGGETKIGDDYQIQKANLALASGGMFGQGYLHGTQTQLRFLPVRHTDFIFSVIGEELGFVGATSLVLLLMLVIWRCLRAAWVAHDTFGRLICVSVAAVLFLQTYINLGMQVKLPVPVTGVVLPFVSYGRSNLITAMIAIGLVESVAMRYKRLEF